MRDTHPLRAADAMTRLRVEDLEVRRNRLASIPEPVGPDMSARLTPREREVMELVAEGKRNSEIAEELWISPGTVRKHLENVYAKLGVCNRTAALAKLRG